MEVQDASQTRRFGFVNFESREDAKAALAGMNGMIVGKVPLYVARFQSRAERQSQSMTSYYSAPYQIESMANMSREGRNIYVKHLAPDVNEYTLFNLFQACFIYSTGSAGF
jgi:polyadenylate-binding protein